MVRAEALLGKHLSRISETEVCQTPLNVWGFFKADNINLQVCLSSALLYNMLC